MFHPLPGGAVEITNREKIQGGGSIKKSNPKLYS